MRRLSLAALLTLALTSLMWWSTEATATPFDGTSSATAGISAKQIQADGFSTGDGLYWLDPDLSGGDAPFLAFADMTASGGGWTLGVLSLDASPAAAIDITAVTGSAGLSTSHTVDAAPLALDRDAEIRYELSDSGGAVFSGTYTGRFDDSTPTFSTTLDTRGLNGTLDKDFNFHVVGNDFDVAIYVRELVTPIPATCGDGVIEGTEQCDDGGTVPGDGCDANCEIEPGWICVGEPSVCSEDCGDGTLTPSEDCDDGNTDPGDCCSPTCQYESAATVCRVAAGVCDAVENCDGASAACPADVKLTTQCRASAHVCDAAETCDGVSDDCGPDMPANGAPCPDGALCNGDEVCVGWVCTAGMPVDCDDDNECTIDSCDEIQGCINDPIVEGPVICDPIDDLPSASPAGRLLLSLLVLGAGAMFLAWRRRGAL